MAERRHAVAVLGWLAGGALVGALVATTLGVVGIRWDAWSAVLVGASLGAAAQTVVLLLRAGAGASSGRPPDDRVRRSRPRPGQTAAARSRAVARAAEDLEACSWSPDARDRLRQELASAGLLLQDRPPAAVTGDPEASLAEDLAAAERRLGLRSGVGPQDVPDDAARAPGVPDRRNRARRTGPAEEHR